MALIRQEVSEGWDYLWEHYTSAELKLRFKGKGLALVKTACPMSDATGPLGSSRASDNEPASYERFHRTAVRGQRTDDLGQSFKLRRKGFRPNKSFSSRQPCSMCGTRSLSASVSPPERRPCQVSTWIPGMGVHTWALTGSFALVANG